MTNPRQLSRTLSTIRRQGFAFGNEEVSLGRVSVAAPIRGPEGVVAALSIVGRASAMDPARLLPAVRTAALSISRASAGLERTGLQDLASRHVSLSHTVGKSTRRRTRRVGGEA